MAAGSGARMRLFSHLQKRTAYDVIITMANYDQLVGHVDAIRIFPRLITSRSVDQDFCQRLDHKVTDKEKMMALLRELTKSTEDTWFDEFMNALSKVPQYEKVADNLREGDWTQHTF